MPPAEPNIASAIRIEVSPDLMVARLSIDPALAPEGVSGPALAERLRASGIAISKDLLLALTDGAQPVKLWQPVTISQGRPPEHDRPGEIRLLVVPATADAPAAHSHYQRSTIITAVAGQKIATYSALKRGRDGVDVYGHPIPHTLNTMPAPGLGANVRLDSDGCTVIATDGGRVRLDNMKLTIDTALDIPGSVDFSVGNIDFPGDIRVAGSILDLFQVRSGGSLNVGASIEAADVEAHQDLIVAGGISGKDKGRCVAGHNLSAKYITNAAVRAGNDLVVTVECANSRIICGGQLRCERGAIIGGHLTAAGGVICRTLGAAAGTPTVVEVGIEQQLRDECGARLTEVADQRKQVQQVRQVVEPLLRNQKQLTPQQKEKATELLFNASELEAKTSGTIQALRSSYESMQARSKADAKVGGTLHAGTILRFPGVEAIVEQSLRGPLRISRRGSEGKWQVCACGGGGSVVLLKTRAFVDKTMQALAQALRAA